MCKKISKFLLFCIILSYFLVGFNTNTSEATDKYDRIAGNNRYLTAVEVSKKGWPSSADTVLLARGDVFADALSAVPLAHSLNAPILLTQPERLPEETMKEIERLRPAKIYILGGTSAISSEVEDYLLYKGQEVERIGGVDRFETAVMIANRLAPQGAITAVVVYGFNFPDALAAASYAAAAGMPILLTDTLQTPEATLDAINDLDIQNVIVVGGTQVISNEVVKNQFPNAIRVWGGDRYETAVALAEHFQPSGDLVFIATGLDFADAITGAVLAAKQNRGMLLVGRSAPEVVKNYFLQKNIQSATVLGGTNAVSKNIADSLFNLSGLKVIFTTSSQLYSSPGGGAVLRYPYHGYVTEVLEDNGQHLKIRFGSKEGWVSRTHVEVTDKEKDYIRLGWQWMSGTDIKFLQRSPNQSGYNVYAPVMYGVNESGIYTLKNYSNNIALARQKGYQVWLTVQQFGISPNLQSSLITQIVDKAREQDVDGVNIDFEGMGLANRDKFTKFIQDLYKEMKKNDLTLTVDVVRPAQSVYSLCYDRKALAQASDYLILMAYDQHWSTSPDEGSVADLPWTEDSIVKVLSEGVPAQKLILGIPFYSRNWRVGIKPLEGKVIVTGDPVNIRSAPNTTTSIKLHTASRHEF
ncbi:MAG: cell wall-binding repeat-containing protein, partial [bacterium]|nr:cell wall-binding repeat-containing protein [bacterium]